MSRTLRWVFALAFLILFGLHQDIWWWDSDRSVLGLPIGLTYHLGYCGLVSIVLFLVVRALDRASGTRAGTGTEAS